MVPRTGHVMTEQRHRMQPQTLSYFDPSALLQTAIPEDLDVGCSVVQVQHQVPGGLETPLVESSHLPRGFEQSSTAHSQTLRDFEKHLNDLKKENFSLKLRIYFLEERVQQKYEASREDVHKRNIELKVEVESLKKELQEKQQSLDKVGATAEKRSNQNAAEICHQQKNGCDYVILEKKICLLQEEAQAAKAEAERVSRLAEAEKERCLELTKQLAEFSKKQDEIRENQALLETYSLTLVEKDRKIEELTWNLSNSEKLLQLLSSEKQNLLQRLEASQKTKAQNLHCDQQQQTQSDSFLGEQATKLKNEELLEKIHHFSATNKQLQEKLNEMNFELKSVQHASQIQDHKIQNLNEAVKSKESESEELYHVIERQNETIAKLRDMLHRSQLGQLQSSEGSSSLQQKQQISLLDMQNTLFFAQLEVQQLKRTEWQKDRQLAEARRTAQLLETVLQEERHQKESAWKHNQELRATVQQLQAELQNKNWECSSLESGKSIELQRQEQKIQHLSHKLACKERLLQESKELLQYHENLDKSPTSADNMVQKLQQRIKDRDAILEQAVDEKFGLLEEREQELQRLRLSVRERERDLEELRAVLSSNETTIQGLESLLKARSLELDQKSANYQNLHWLKGELEAKFRSWQAEQKGIIQQLQAALHDKNKEVEALSATLLCKLGPGQRDIVEEMCLRLQQKEQIIQGLLRDKSQRAIEQESELQELFQAMSAREQQNHIFSEKMAQALVEKSCELQVLRQHLVGRSPRQKSETSIAPLFQKDQLDEAGRTSGESSNITNPKEEDGRSRMETGVLEKTAGLEKQLVNAKKELDLLTQKERESRLELSALRSVVASQEEELQVQASDVESLTRSIQIKEELIKDLQMQLVDPEEMPAMERLTQEVLMLQEKVARVELQAQEATGNRKLQLLLLLEGLAAEKNQLNEALQAERQLYSTWMKCHAHPHSSEQEQTLQVELERIQALRGQLEEALERSLERLNRLDSLDGIGGPAVTEDAEDASTEFTDSIEEDEEAEEEVAAHRVTQQQNTKGDANAGLAGHSGCPAPASVARESRLQEELLSAKLEIQQILEQKKKLARELQDLKGQVEEAGFSSVSHLRKALLSLCLENAELKEQVGEAMLSEGWENEDEKEGEDSLRLEVKKLREKLHTSERVIGLLREQLNLNSQGGKGTFRSQFAADVTQEGEQLQTAKQGPCQGILHDDVPQRHCPVLQAEDSSPSQSPKGTQVGASSFWQPFMAPAKQLQSDLPQCRQPCHALRDKLLVSEATIQAQTAQLEQYRALLSEPLVQRDSKHVQVDLLDLGYETCGRSENEADREEATSPECEEHDEFRVESKSWKKLLGSPPSRLGKTETLLDCSHCDDDAAVLRQQLHDLKVQLQNSQRTVQGLQSCVRSMSTARDCASGGEHAQKLKQDYALGSSPSHSMTDEDEGWHSDSLGSFCPPSLQPSKELGRLIQRVSLLEAELGKAKPEVLLPEELKPATSVGKYDSLVQAQARELSHLRQVMREGQGLGHLLRQHFRDTIKSFEELLRGTDMDYFLGQSFREQLVQGNHLAGQLARKLNSRNDQNMEEKSGHELLALRLSKELQEKEQIIKNLHAKLQARPVTPSSSHSLSESPRSGSSASFLSEGLSEGSSTVDDVSEYICFQEDSSEGQPHSLLDTDLGRHTGKTSARPSHPHPATASHVPTSESIQRNLTLPASQHSPQIATQPSRGLHPESLARPASFPLAPRASRACSFLPLGPPPAPAPLLGCCRTPVFSLAEAQQELQMLQKQLAESATLPALSTAKPESLVSPFSAGSPAVSSKNCLQACHPVPQALHMQNSAERNRNPPGGATGEHRHSWDIPQFRQPPEHFICRSLPSWSSTTLSGQKLSGADLLEEHLSEIRILRQRLEESICTNDRLREQLETRLTSVAKIGDLQEALRASHSKLHDGEVELEEQRIEQKRLQEEIRSKQRDLVQLQEKCLALQENNTRLQNRVALLQQQCEENRLLFQTLQAELRVYGVLCGPPQKATSGAHPEDDLLLGNDGNKQGAHVIGHFKHWNTLRQQVLEGQTLIHKMESCLQPGLESQNCKAFHRRSITQLLASTSSLRQILEKSSSLLGMFWKTALPTQFSAQEQAMREEIQALRAKLAEHESRLQSASHVKDSAENFLLTHLTKTYDVLRRARTNLEAMSQQPAPIRPYS